MKIRRGLFRFSLFSVIFLLLILGMVACNGDSAPPSGEESGETPSESSKPAEVKKPSSIKPGGVGSLDGVKSAVIQIEAQGTFIDPEFGLMANVAGRGSGFIIDPSGIAVTNNHVVAGAALLKVWVGGERDSVNAKILGVSECFDLAVIQIEGDDFPYLDWREGNIDVGLDVYTAGFPLGDPEYTLTRGIVSKAHADGETNWASIDHVLEHDATINPGNSGGPLVDTDGSIVGVNYAGAFNSNQYFAISRDQAVSVVETLSEGEGVHTIGINGSAVSDSSGSLTGIWVSSVVSGSPADEAGILPGDIITTMEGLTLAMDGTMADYCDILRTHGQDSTLSVEVLRYGTGEYLSGQINGRELAVSIPGGISPPPGGDELDEPPQPVGDYMVVMDDYGALELEIPTYWSDLDGSPWYFDGEIVGASIWASPDLDSFNNTWNTPGVIFDVSDDIAKWVGYIELLDIRRDDMLDYCEFDARYDYEDALYRGKFDLYYKCGGSGGPWYMVLSAVSQTDQFSYLILVEAQIVYDEDWDIAQHVLDTFMVVGELP